MAVGAPSRALMRRIKAPMAVLLCIAPWAASRNIPAARFLVFLDLELRTLPPLMRLSGHTLSQEQKCCSLFQQFMSKPVSEMMTSTARCSSRATESDRLRKRWSDRLDVAAPGELWQNVLSKLHFAQELGQNPLWSRTVQVVAQSCFHIR